MQPECRRQCLAIRDLTIATPLQQLRRAGREDLEKLTHIELALARCQAARKPDVNKLGGVGNKRMQAPGQRPLGGTVAGFFEQFTLCALLAGLAGIELSGGKLDHHLSHRIAKLPLQHDLHLALGIAQQGNNHDGTRMAHILAHSAGMVGQSHRVAKGVQKIALEQFLAGELVLGQMAIIHRRTKMTVSGAQHLHDGVGAQGHQATGHDSKQQHECAID